MLLSEKRTVCSFWIHILLWNHVNFWGGNFMIQRHWTCSWTFEFVELKLHAILLKGITISLGSEMCGLPYLQIHEINCPTNMNDITVS